jgi:hypothetical protein
MFRTGTASAALHCLSAGHVGAALGVTARLRSGHAEMPHHPLHDVEVSKDAAKSIGGEFLRRIFEFFDPSTRPVTFSGERYMRPWVSGLAMIRFGLEST